jgi:hypothetical protein
MPGDLTPWVVLHNRTPEVFAIKMGVNLCGRDGFVAKHFLYGTKISTSFHKMRGKGMTEGMRTDGFLQAGFQGKFFDNSEDHHTGEPGSPAVQK